MSSPKNDNSNDRTDRNVGGAKEYPVCDQCRIKKIRCGRERPNCANCARLGIECEWSGSGKRPSQTVMLNNAVVGLEGRIDRLEKNMSDIQATLARLDYNTGETLFTPASRTVQDPVSLNFSTHTHGSTSSTSKSPHPRDTALRPGHFRLLHRADGTHQYFGSTSLDSLINNLTHSILVPSSQTPCQHIATRNELMVAKHRLFQIVSEAEFLPSPKNSSPPTTPPLGILQPMVDEYFDNINRHMPIWSRDRFQDFIADMQLSSGDQPHAAHGIFCNSLAILILTAKLASSSRNSGSSWSSIDLELVKYFLSNATWAVHNLHELMTQRLSNIQALLSLHLVAQIHWGSERAILFLTLATAGAKPLGLHQLESFHGYTQDEMQERKNIFLCLYILDKTRCWIDGQPPQVPLWHPEVLLSHSGIDLGLLARAKLSRIEEAIFVQLYSDVPEDQPSNGVDNIVSNLTQMLQQFSAECRLDDPHDHHEMSFARAELTLVVCALQVLLHWRTGAEDAMVTSSSKCLSLFIDLWRQNAGPGNHLTVIRILIGYASVSFIKLCSFIILNRTGRAIDSVIGLMTSFIDVLRSISRVAQTNIAIKKLTEAGEIVLNLCSNRSSPGAWPETSQSDCFISPQGSRLHMSPLFTNVDPLTQTFASVSAGSAISSSSGAPYTYALESSPTNLALLDSSMSGRTTTNLNLSFADLDFQQWALELLDDGIHN
ncbi:fungal specific transcription factor factor [Fusarium mexicanum]|uniref:Fungal specific transcription factor factor n=1 Tax=Fusarium mexicanum TaxID=751941 RepID=A0A8H5JGN0_9HYPO|nr:fungal specific transcription factor factor [Fusarium mexicanum]